MADPHAYNSRMHFHIWSIGCQMNTADARRIGDELEAVGGMAVPHLEDADIVILYSCVVRHAAQETVHNELIRVGQAKRQRPSMRVALAGCMVEDDTVELARRYPFIDRFLSPKTDLPVRDQVVDLLDLDERYRVDPSDAERVGLVSQPVTISQGCNRRCTYCVIPFRRGDERSRHPREILREVRSLGQRGAKEVVLLGQIVDRYGKDIGTTLGQLLAEASEVDEIARIRFLTSYPVDFDGPLMEAVATLPKVCEDVNLPVQAGDDAVLRRMARGYKTMFYERLVDEMRSVIPRLSLSTDIIVGFCGELEAQFENTLALLERVRFDVVHVAMYSPRPGTASARLWPDDVPQEEKKRRLHEVERVQSGIAGEINGRVVGTTQDVLVEGQRKGKWFGRTRNNKLLFFSSDRDLAGLVVPVEATGASSWSLQGQLVDPVPTRIIPHAPRIAS
ncbi:MAG: MiaB/RimO family radical SAM methylthiotransferase [Chloroflexi bacterium]|nr:MiaB/RimO family radical SAM methylthiotransferase [Chloroflexota bacterium]